MANSGQGLAELLDKLSSYVKWEVAESHLHSKRCIRKISTTPLKLPLLHGIFMVYSWYIKSMITTLASQQKLVHGHISADNVEI